jgi:hypothetical protein
MNLKFSQLPNDDPRGDNAVMANFRDEDLSLLDIFIREFLQNALDNRIETKDEEQFKTVNINISISEIEQGSNKNFIENIFNPSALSFINSIEQEDFEMETITALILEENNTKGITGQKNNSNDNGNWAKFWHAQSSSSKTGNKNGRAGQGKISYHMISNVYTVFGLTNPTDSPENLYLMGKCILPSNPLINNIAYKPHAFISEIEDENNQPIPYEDADAIEAFSETFSLNRKPGDFGTSWIIPFPKSSGKGQPKEKEIIKSTIKGYFYSILMNKLTIKVGEVLINSETIIDLAEKYIGESESDFYNFIKNTQENDVVLRREMLPQRWINNTSLPDDIISQEKIDSLKSDYRKGKIISVKLPIIIDSKEGKKTSDFIVYLQSKEHIEDSMAAFVRSDLIISNESAYILRQQGVYCLVVADDEPIANFLANCEIPNHTAFNHAMKAAIENYNPSSIQKTLSNIRMGSYRVYAFLDEVDSGSHPDALIDVLSVMGLKKPPPKPEKEIDDEIDETDSPESDEGSEESEVPEIYSDNKYFKIEDDGGKIQITPGVEKLKEDQLPVGFRIVAGYESVDGIDPIDNHHHFDFDFTNSNSISIIQEGLVNIESQAKPNELILHIENVNFYLELSGFSLNTRLRIRTAAFEVEE